MKTSLSAFLLIISMAGLHSCIKPAPTDDKRTKIQAEVENVRKGLADSLGIAFPSLSLIIQTPTDKFFVTATADGSQVVTPDTYYRIASNTKTFTATAIMNMYEDGWLDYRAKITDIIPGSKAMTYVPGDPAWDIPFKDEITIRQILQHVSGIYDVDNEEVPGYGGDTYPEAILKTDPKHQFTTTEMVAVVTRLQKRYGKPNTVYNYSNTGYSVLAEIIKRVYSFRAGSAKTYNDYMNDYVTGKNARVPLPKIHFALLASDIKLPSPFIGSTMLEKTGPTYTEEVNLSAQLGEGNGYSTMDELHTFIRTLSKGQNVLNDSTIRLMQTDLTPLNQRYGLGMSYTANLGWGHSGARVGSLNQMSYDPKTDVSILAMIPMYDLRRGDYSFGLCILALHEAAYRAREILGYPGKP